MGDGRRNARTRSPAFPGEWTGAAKGRHHTIGSGYHTMGNVLVRACAPPRIHLSEFVPIYFHPSLFGGHRFPWRRRDEEKVPMFFEHLPFLYERLPIFFAGEGQRGSKKRSCQSTPMEVLEYSPRNTPVLLWKYSSTAPRVLEYCRESTRVLSAKY